MRLSPLEERITRIIEPTVTGLGYRLVCVQESSDGGAYSIQIMAENPVTRGLGMDDCTKLNRAIGAVLDVEDPVSGAYRLEISSPGIDRLLVGLDDFAEYIGFDVKAEIDPPIEGQKRFRGNIAGVQDNVVVLKTDNGDAHLPFPAIQRAKLVMNDQLLKETQRRFNALKEKQKEEEQSAQHAETQ